MEQRLLQDLHQKLGGLEHKVRAYRCDLAAEFQRYCHQALHDVPAAVALNVEQALATSLSDYPALGPELQITGVTGSLTKQRAGPGAGGHHSHHNHHTLLQVADESLQAEATTATPPAYPNQTSPPPPGAVFGAAVDPAAGSDSPHEREKEFQGLFTPFFLPLLESSPNLPSSPPPLSAASPSFAEPVTAGTGIGSGLGVHVGTADQLQGSPQHLQGRDMEGSGETGARQRTSEAASPTPSRPDNARRSTDDTTTSSSVLSDRSDTKVPRSALRRRSSSSSKAPHTSPRRVRFQFKGAEVLPTASPQPSDFPTPRPSSPTASDQPRTFDEIVGNNGDNEEYPPEQALPPRKISSSEALRALSRAPLDEGTVWTVVNPGPEEDTTRTRSKDSSSAISTMGPSTATGTSGPVPTPSEASGIRQLPTTQHIPQPRRPLQEEDDEESSEDEFLALAKPKSFKNKLAILPSSNPRSPDKTSPNEKAAPGVAPKREGDDKDQPSSDDLDEEENVFYFETGGLTAPPKPKYRPPPLKEEDTAKLAEPDDEIGQVSQTAASTAVAISRPSDSPEPSTPTAAKFHIGSLGSYKGRPVVMPVVKDPNVHAQAASLGDFNTFVGGLDGRSGVDEGDLNSFRASLVQSGFSGTPRSLTERMMMEDAQAERRNGS